MKTVCTHLPTEISKRQHCALFNKMPRTENGNHISNLWNGIIQTLFNFIPQILSNVFENLNFILAPITLCCKIRLASFLSVNITDELNSTQQTISDHIRTLRWGYKYSRWVPHELSGKNIHDRVSDLLMSASVEQNRTFHRPYDLELNNLMI